MSKKYSLTDEHRAQLVPWKNKWVENAMSTKPMTDDDRVKCRIAVKGLYEAAGLVPPPENRIVFVASPFILRFAAGFAAAIWHLRKNSDATYDATRAATSDATRAATDAATRAATDAATSDATYAATRDATDAATSAATSDATRAATRAATYDATYDATEKKDKWFSFNINAAVSVSISLQSKDLAVRCAQSAYRMWQGGNQWSAWDSFLSFFRHVAKLDIDYSKYEHWETLALRSGPRIMHPDFCMISDRPTVLSVDARNRPHCIDGPFCRWSDGSALFAIDGVRMPQWVAETPSEMLDIKEVMRLPNAEQRLVAIKKIGPERMLTALNATSISKKADEYELYSVFLEGSEERLLKMQNPSEPKIHFEWVAPECKTVNEALAWRRGITIFTETVART